MEDLSALDVTQFKDAKQAWQFFTVRLLFAVIFSDMKQGQKEAYVKGVKQLLRTLKRFFPPETTKHIETEMGELNEAIDIINKAAGTEAQKNKQILDIQYIFMDGLVPYIHDCLGASPIMEHQIDAVLIYDQSEVNLAEYGKMVRQKLNLKNFKYGDSQETKKDGKSKHS